MSYASSTSSDSMCDSYERDWTVVCNKKIKNKAKNLSKAPLMKLDNMSIRVLSVESRPIERREKEIDVRSMKEVRSKKMKRGGVRTRMSKLLRSSGYTFITRKMIDRLIEAEKMKKMKETKPEVEVEDEEVEEDVEVDEVEEDEVESGPPEPSYEMVGHYFDPQNLSVVSPDGVKCEDVIEKAARISEWWTRVLGYKVY